ncbi:MAG: hypothetical protein KY467_03875 [Gemmatimonadetes bacterium]|nr:hypothetical protein [Gemmatimonadota bacterium]
MRSRARSVVAARVGGISCLAIGFLLAAAAPLAAQETPAHEIPAGFGLAQTRTMAYPDARLRPSTGLYVDAAGTVEAKPILSTRGVLIGGAVGCLYGAWRFATASGASGRIALGHGVGGCLLLSVPGMLFGGIWIP